MIPWRHCPSPSWGVAILVIQHLLLCNAFLPPFSAAIRACTASFPNIQAVQTNDDADGNSIQMHSNKLTTASGKPISRYALGGAARSTQPENLPLHYKDILSNGSQRNIEKMGEDNQSSEGGGAGAPFYFYYNPHRYPAFLAGVVKSFVNPTHECGSEGSECNNNEISNVDSSDKIIDNKSSNLHRGDVFIASGSSDRTPSALDKRLEDALLYSGGDYLDAFVLEYVCPEEIIITEKEGRTNKINVTDAKLGPELERAIQHVRLYVAEGKVRYVMASTHSHVVGAVLASTSLPYTAATTNESKATRESTNGNDEDNNNHDLKTTKHTPAVDALMLRYNLSHKAAAESLSLPCALRYDIPVLAFTTTRWNRLQKDVSISSSDCVKFALQHPAVEVVLHSARDEKELEETLFPLMMAASSSSSSSSTALNDGSGSSNGCCTNSMTWISEEEYERLRLYGNEEMEWNQDDGFDEYPEETNLLASSFA
mmetsp:Transcript_9892/g.19220  ORF Transcript_9892/g.19220 Transcript_9892/m.19220 type:complete len:484 (-) Transcript_9892:34-1485(-)